MAALNPELLLVKTIMRIGVSEKEIPDP